MKMHNIHFENNYSRFICFYLLFNGLFLTTAFGQNIPDVNFANAIRATCPTCIDGSNNLTADATTFTNLNVANQNITNLTGIGGFTSLTHLYCQGNQLTALPTLPINLVNLNCSGNQIVSLTNLPNLISLECQNNQLTNITALPSSLTWINFNNNKLTSLPTLPTGLTHFYGGDNLLTSVPTLPNSITGVILSNNQLTTLPNIPSSATDFACSNNQLTSLPTLSSTLFDFSCFNNNITVMPTLPTDLTRLILDADKISCLPNKPVNLRVYDGINTTNIASTYPICTAPLIFGHPSVSNPICVGNSVTLTANANGSGNLMVKWQRKGASDANYTDLNVFTLAASGFNTTYSFTATLADNGASYRAVFSDRYIEATSNAAAVTMSTGVHIVDANFANAIRMACPTCIDVCDNLTAAAANLTTLDVVGKNISNLTGLEGFTSLTILNCSTNQLTSLPTLPTTLQHLVCANNQITTLPTLPNGLIQLYIDYNLVATLPTLPSTLQTLYAGGNRLTTLPILPTGLKYFSCWSNQISALPSTLPTGLVELGVYNNPLSTLPDLPTTLQHLSCYATTIDCFPTLPMGLTALLLDPTRITCLPNFPTSVAIYNGAGNVNIRNAYSLCTPPLVTKHPSVADLTCGTSLTLVARATTFNATTVKWQRKGALDANYTDLNAPTAYNSNTDATYNFTKTNADNDASYRAVFMVKCNESITNAVVLRASLGIHIPDANFATAIRTACATCIDACNDLTTDASTVTNLDVNSKNISDLTGINGFSNLQVLYCYINNLTTLPTLPPTLTQLYCARNQLTTLPNNLPSNLQIIYADYNRLTSLPTLPSNLVTLYLGSNLLASAPDLPSGLQRFSCWSNQITALPNSLPTGLIELGVYNNPLSNLPNLPSTLQHLSCYGTNISCLPTLPMGLNQLLLDPTRITCLPNFPTNLAVYNGAGTANIRNTFSLCAPPNIVTHPSVTNPVCVGGVANLSASATGSGAMTVKWQIRRTNNANFVDLAPATSYTSGATATYNYTFTSSDNGASVRAVFSALCIEWETNDAPIFLSNGIHVPDANFAATIRLYCPSCINACNDLTALAANLTELNLYGRNIEDLTGLEGFTNLQKLNCGGNTNLRVLPNLPASLLELNGVATGLTSLPTLPSGLVLLQVDYTPLTSLPSLPNSLKILWCNGNRLTNLPTLPNGLTKLSCEDNLLTSLPSLPSTLTDLQCGGNRLQNLPTLPSGLQVLTCQKNQLTTLPALPNGIYFMDCGENLLQNLPTLPSNLQSFKCNNNQLQMLPALPSLVREMDCSSNQLQTLPTLSSNLDNLFCSQNNIYCLPTLPSGLDYIVLDADKITCVPNITLFLRISNKNGVDITANYGVCTSSVITVHPSVSNPVCIGSVVTLTAQVVGNNGMTIRWQGKRATDVNYVETVAPTTYISGTVASANIVVENASNGNSYRAVFTTCNGELITNATTFTVSTGLHIPNANFATAIRNQCANCIDNCNNLTTNAANLTSLNVSSSNINDLTGIEAFTSLQSFYCNYNSLTSLPNNLPSGLTTLSCTNTLINTLPTLPSGLTALYCGGTFINTLPTLPNTLRTLDCSNAYLTALPSVLPSGLLSLNCSSNQLTSLPDLPTTLLDLNCNSNALTSLPPFYNKIQYLYCQNNLLTSLPSSLPADLKYLRCQNNRLTDLPSSLTPNILEIECYDNNIYCLPTLPNALTNLKLDKLKITCLPNTIAGLVIQNRDIAGDISSDYGLCTVPSITTHPLVSGSPQSGQTTSFTTKATNNSATTVKWQRKGAADANFTDISGSESTYTSNTDATYNTPNLTNTDIGASYRAVFTSQCSGDATTNAVTLNFTVLPVELTTFSGKAFDEYNALTWSVATQRNASHFIVERMGNDAKNWTAIGQVAVQSNSDYQFDDKQPLRLAYYRLVAVDLDGSVSYSKTISIDRQNLKNQRIKVYPNPATSDLTIEILSNTEGVEIINAIGQVVFKEKTMDKNAVHIDINTWKSGIYFIRTTGATTLVKFIKN